MTTPFVDLKDNWYRDAVTWAYNNGIVKGTSETTFSPSATITRQQLVTMVYHYMGDPGTSGDLSAFNDSSIISSYARDAVAWAVARGLVTGFNDGTFRPKNPATRGQLAAILHQLDTMD